MTYWNEYTWLVVAGVFAAFFMSIGIGANDVANALATSVGSKALKLWQAVIIGGIFEFAGAVLLGRGVTSTIRRGILDSTEFTAEPEILMYGMLCALLAAGIWLLIATYLEMPVSTTHSIIGGLVGFGLVAKGAGSVVWYQESNQPLKFEGLLAVLLSWILSPLFAGTLSLTMFATVRSLIMRRSDSYERVFYFFPVLVLVAVWINLFYILDKGVTKQVEIRTSDSVWISLVVAVGTALATAALMPWLRQYINKKVDTQTVLAESGTVHEAKPEGALTPSTPGPPPIPQTPGRGANNTDAPWFHTLTEGVQHDVHCIDEMEKRVQDIHSTAEIFDPRAESGFRYLQVFTACCDSFAHGANDVSNAIGPFSAIWEIYRHGQVIKTSSIPIWILFLGGAGIALGLSLFGYKIIRALGVRMVKVTSSRGFAIELGSALVVVTGSRLNLPLSTTHCQVGSTVAVGMLENGWTGVNWPLFLRTLVGWVATIVVVGCLSAVFTACGIYTPNLRSVQLTHSLQRQNAELGLATINDLRGCPAAGFQANLDRASDWITKSSMDNFEVRGSFDSLSYTNTLYTESSAIVCPDQFDEVPLEAVKEYDL